MILKHKLLVVGEGLPEKSESGKPVLELFILNDNPVKVLVESEKDKIEICALTARKNFSPALVVLLQALLHVLRKVRPLVGCIEGAGEQDNCHLEWDRKYGHCETYVTS